MDLNKVSECPECGSMNVLYSKYNSAIVCRDCGVVFAESIAIKPAKPVKTKVKGRAQALEKAAVEKIEKLDRTVKTKVKKNTARNKTVKKALKKKVKKANYTPKNAAKKKAAKKAVKKKAVKTKAVKKNAVKNKTSKRCKTRPKKSKSNRKR